MNFGCYLKPQQLISVARRQFTVSTTSKSSKNSNEEGLISDARIDEMAQQSEYKIRDFSKRMREKFDHLEEVKADDLRKYRPVKVDEWERLRKQYDDQRLEFRQQVEQQKPKFYQPGNWERYWLVVSGMYSNLSEVPEMINLYQVKDHRKSLARRLLFLLVAMYFSMAFLYRCDCDENFD